jgi:UDP-galactose-lipid carrier transferase
MSEITNNAGILPNNSFILTDKGSYSLVKNRCVLILADLLAFSFAFIMVSISFFTEDKTTLANLLIKTDLYRVSVFIGIVFLSIVYFWVQYRHYTYRKPFWSELKEIFSVLAIMALIDMLLISLNTSYYPSLQWLFIWGTIFVLIPLMRVFAKKILMYLGYWQLPSVIIGSAENAREAYYAINSEKAMGFDVKAFVDPENSRTDFDLVSGIPQLLMSQEKSGELHDFKVFIAFEYSQRELRDQWIRTLSAKGVRNISVIPALRGVPLYNTEVTHFFSHEVMMLRLNNNLVRRYSRLLKRTFDIVVSSMLLILLAPLFIYIGWKVTRDGGVPTYGHERIGFNGKKFKCLKFRSMIMNSKEVLSELLASSAEAKAEWDKDFKLKNDPRITTIGGFLRKSSLDELPQLWNVFKGEMSLVGPRPIIEEELARYNEDRAYYLMAKPGMTGLWQVSGRNDVDYDTRIYFDSWYVKNWSLWTDIAILFKTVGVVFNRDGAY